MDRVMHRWKVESDSVKGLFYTVEAALGCWHCNCPHHVYRGKTCKHIRICRKAVEISASETMEDIEIDAEVIHSRKTGSNLA